jgi:flagellar biosynthesis/type III secretory pathway M-ring protein FliF/YscJ
MDWLRQILGQAFAAFRDMTAAQRASMVMLGLTIVLTLGIVAFLGGRPKWVAVASGLDQNEMAEVQRYLEDAGEDYKADPSRGVILVSQDRQAVLRKRLLAGQVVTIEKVFSYEEFIEKTSGIHTPNRQRDELLRIALQNEIRKMIEGLEGVEKAHVEIEKEADREFGSLSGQKVGVAVTVDTRRTLKMDQPMANTIIDLVHSAVRSSDPQKITVVDSRNWRHKFKREDPDSVIVQSDTRWDLTRAVNNYYREKIESFIRRANYESAVTVDCKLNLDAVRETNYDVDGEDVAVYSVEKHKSSSRGAGGVGGAVGLNQQSPSGVMAGGTASSNATNYLPGEDKRDESVLRQDFSRVLREIVGTPGTIDDIRVGVILFHRIVQRENKRTGEIEEIFEAPSDEMLNKNWPELIAQAAGMDPKLARDPEDEEESKKITVVAMKPDRLLPSSFVKRASTLQDRVREYWPQARLIGVFLLAAFALFFLYGLGRRAATGRPAPAAVQLGARVARGARGGAEKSGRQPADPGDVEIREMQDRVRAFVEEDPRKVAGLLKRWLVREG